MTGERVAFRYVVGMLAMLGGLFGTAGLYLLPIPEGNREPLLLALGIVLGWGSSIINGEWGSSPAGRKAAEVGVRLAEEPRSDAPKDVNVVNPPSDPVQTEEARP